MFHQHPVYVAPIVGHNRSPDDDVDPLLERLREDNPGIHGRAAQLLSAESRIPDVAAEGTVGKIADYVKQIRECLARVKAAHDDAKAPFLASGRTVDGWARSISDPLGVAQKRAQAKVDAFMAAKADAERKTHLAEIKRLAALARETADKDAAKALRAEAADLKAAPVKPSLTTGLGGTVSTRTEWTHEVKNWDEVDLETLRRYLDAEAIEKAIRAFVRDGGRQLKGVKIWQKTGANIR